MSRFPFTSFPTSWYRVARSDDLGPGAVIDVPLCGEQVRVARNDDGSLESPGRLVQEMAGLVFVWYAPDAARPTYELPGLPEHASPRWTPMRRMSWRARTHVQEGAENAVDSAHFQALHKHIDMPTLEEVTPDGAQFRVVFHARRKVLGREVQTTIRLFYYGLGMVIARVETGPADVVVLITYTPVDEEHIAIHLHWSLRKTANVLKTWFAPFFLERDIREDFSRDIPVWENKRYLERPVLCAGDGPIMVLRKWARQFYRESADAAVSVNRTAYASAF